MEKEGKDKYVAVGALLNFIGPDRPELLFAIKEVLRASSAPRARDEQRLKRILRFLRLCRHETINFEWQEARPVVTVRTDSDFAGCRDSRRSTAGGCVLWHGALIKAWSKTLSTIALSTGEAELFALVKGATEVEGVRAVLSDFGPLL